MKEILLCTLFATALSVNAQSTDLNPEWTFTKGIEGAAHDAKKNIYACNFSTQGTVGIYKDSKAELFATLPEGSVGNGIVFDSKGNMYIADYVGHNIFVIKKGGNKAELYAHNPQMTQPNDLAINPHTGIIYASDPAWKLNSGRLWMVRENKITLLEENMGTTNGLDVSPDGRLLYVNESNQRNIWVYDILKDGSLGNKRLFYKFSDYGMDGMRCDSRGNIWLTRHSKGTILILSPKGKELKELNLKGKNCSNITLIESKKSTKAYITMADRGLLEVIEVDNSALR